MRSPLPRGARTASPYNFSLNLPVFLAAAAVLLAVQFTLVVREAKQARAGGRGGGRSTDVAWVALPALLVAALLAYSLVQFSS